MKKNLLLILTLFFLFSLVLYPAKADIEKKEFYESLTYDIKNTAMVVATGDFDFNKNEAFKAYELYQSTYFQKSFFINKAGGFHGPLTSSDFEKAVNFLDESRKK